MKLQTRLFYRDHPIGEIWVASGFTSLLGAVNSVIDLATSGEIGWENESCVFTVYRGSGSSRQYRLVSPEDIFQWGMQCQVALELLRRKKDGQHSGNS